MFSDSKEIILALIKADLCNKKLISGLENAGLEVPDFYGDLETVILFLMGFDLQEREEQMHDLYYETMDRLLKIEVKEFRKNLDGLGVEMYEGLARK